MKITDIVGNIHRSIAMCTPAAALYIDDWPRTSFQRVDAQHAYSLVPASSDAFSLSSAAFN